MDDVAKFATRSRVVTVASIGTSDAGKTTFLATLYLLLLSGQSLDGYKFAGSFTLGGWEILADKMRWSGNEPPTFPDHTPRRISRQPGLLHLAMRDRNDRLCDVLFADAPGEWFEHWAVDRNDPQAEGARWLERHADSVLMFLDSERLSSAEHCGDARFQSLKLLDRVFASYSDRSIGIVWAKHDTFRQNSAIDAVKQDIDKKGIISIFNVISANTHSESQDVMKTATWSIQQALKEQAVQAISVPVNGTNPFLSFRGRRHE
jgi:Double-GTPase 2